MPVHRPKCVLFAFGSVLGHILRPHAVIQFGTFPEPFRSDLKCYVIATRCIVRTARRIWVSIYISCVIRQSVFCGLYDHLRIYCAQWKVLTTAKLYLNVCRVVCDFCVHLVWHPILFSLATVKNAPFWGLPIFHFVLTFSCGA